MDAKIETKICHDNFSFDFVKRILVLSTRADSPERPLRINFQLAFEKLKIYYSCDPTTIIIPKTSKTSPVSLAFFHGLTFYKLYSLILIFSTLCVVHDQIFQRKLSRRRLPTTFVYLVSHASAEALRPITFTQRFRTTRHLFSIQLL